MLNEIAHRLDVTLRGVPYVGDSLKDIQTAQAVGARPMLVKTGKGERTLASGMVQEDIPVFENLASCVDDILDSRY